MKLIIVLVLTTSFTAFAQDEEKDVLRGDPFRAQYFDMKADDSKPLWNLDLKKGEIKPATDASGFQINEDEKTNRTTYRLDDESFLTKDETTDGHRLTAFDSFAGTVRNISSLTYNAQGLTDYVSCNYKDDCTIITPKVCQAILPFSKDLEALTKKEKELKQCISLFDKVGKAYDVFNEVSEKEFENAGAENSMRGVVRTTGRLLPREKSIFLGLPFVKYMKTPNSSLLDSLVQMKPVAETCKDFIEKGYFGTNLKTSADDKPKPKKDATTNQ